MKRVQVCNTMQYIGHIKFGFQELPEIGDVSLKSSQDTYYFHHQAMQISKPVCLL